MKPYLKMLLAVLLLAWPGGARGDEIPTGTYHATFSSANGDLLVFDMSGSYERSLTPEVREQVNEQLAKVCDAIGLPGQLTLISNLLGDVQINYTLNMDHKGKFTGTGHLTAVLVRPETVTSSIVFNVGINITGSIKTTGKVTRLKTNVRLSGDITMAFSYTIISLGATVKLDVPLQQQLVVNGRSGRITGSVSGRAVGSLPDFKIKKTWPIRGNMAMTMPKFMTGGWNLLVNLTHLNLKYAGDGTVTLYNGLVIPMRVSGRYSEKKDTSDITCQGTGDFTGAQMSIKGMQYTGPASDPTVLASGTQYTGNNILGQGFQTTMAP